MDTFNRDANTSMKDLEFANDILNKAQEEGLVTEVVVWAIKHMQERPKISIREALTAGYQEWIK